VVVVACAWGFPGIHVETEENNEISEPLEPVVPTDRAAWARARETVHIYGETLHGQEHE
jgi:cyanate lyase